jgi:hypothetical protein
VVQPRFIEDEDVIETFPSDRPDEAFHVRMLPGCSRCGQHFVDPHRRRRGTGSVEGVIAIANQVSWCRVPRARLAELAESRESAYESGLSARSTVRRHSGPLADQSLTSWNQISEWFRRINTLKQDC